MPIMNYQIETIFPRFVENIKRDMNNILQSSDRFNINNNIKINPGKGSANFIKSNNLIDVWTF
jgi:hypothetical protein